MPDSETITAFATVFQGTKSRYVVFHGRDSYVSVKRRLTLAQYRQHLTGIQSIALYPFLTGHRVKWLAFDVDTKDDIEAARRIQAFLKQRFDLPSYLEVSKQKGYHLWLFFKQPLAAKIVRRFAAMVLKELSYSFEIFPKQDSPGHGVGNAINLPYFGKDTEKNRRVMIDEKGSPIPLAEFLTHIKMIEPETITKNLPKEEKASGTPRPKRTRNSGSGIFPCIQKALAGGVPVGMRHDWALYLGSYFYRKGLGEDQVRVLLSDWDQRNETPLQESSPDEFEKIVTDSKRYKYGKPQCEAPQFAKLCSEECPRLKLKKSKATFEDPIIEGKDGYLIKTKKGYKKITNFLLVPLKIYGLENREILEIQMNVGTTSRIISISREALRSNMQFKRSLGEGGWDVVFDEQPHILRALRFHLSIKFGSLDVEHIEIQKDVLSLLQHGIETQEISIADFTSSFRRAQTKIGRRVKDHVHLIPSLLLKFITSKGATFESTYELLKIMRSQLTIEPGTIFREGMTHRTWKIPVSELVSLKEITIAEETETDEAETER